MPATQEIKSATAAFAERNQVPVMAGGQCGAAGWQKIASDNPLIDGIEFFVDYYGGAWILRENLAQLQQANLPKHPLYAWSFDDCTRGWANPYPLQWSPAV